MEDKMKKLEEKMKNVTKEDIIKAMKYCCGDLKGEEECNSKECYLYGLPEERNGDLRWCRQWLIHDALKYM